MHGQGWPFLVWKMVKVVHEIGSRTVEISLTFTDATGEANSQPCASNALP